MRLVCVRILVSDFVAAAAFYQDVLRLHPKYVDEAISYGYFLMDENADEEAAGIELVSLDGMLEVLPERGGMALPQLRTGGTVLNIKVDDVDGEYVALVERGAQSISGPVDRAEWGARTAHIADPEGNIIEIYSPLATDGVEG